MGQRNSGEGHELFTCPKREGRHKLDTTKRWVTINFTASRGRVTFFNTNNWCLKHHANILEGRCRKGSNGGDSKEVTMATKPQSTSQAPVNTSLRETSVWSIDTYPKIWEGGRVKKQASEKATQAKAHGNAPANLPGTPQVSQATPLHWLGFNFA